MALVHSYSVSAVDLWLEHDPISYQNMVSSFSSWEGGRIVR